ncbi:MAG TPA: peptidoglycan DD-metalloendopeptidase family protein [Nocardioidaceae bacterium]|jgi:murein DD-endopeptidase MepM/ murein hydrolase activator NlpD
MRRFSAAVAVVLPVLVLVTPAAPARVVDSSPGPETGPAARLGLGLGSPLRRTDPSSNAHHAKPRRFWVRDKHRYSSPWYAGVHRKMIAFGCTPAPYYDPDPRCAHHRGFHHGLDIAMPCGTKLFAGYRTRVVDPTSSGALGSAYGRWAFRLRSARLHKDFVIGHVRRVFVEPGDLVRRGELIARASDAGAPDGCHLHFEVRPVRAGYQSAVRPGPYLRLDRDR